MNSTLNYLVRFSSFEASIPEYGQVQNDVELVANLFLHPARIFLGTLVSKEVSNGWQLLSKRVGAVAVLIILAPLSMIGVILRNIGHCLEHERYGSRTDCSKEVQDRYTDPVIIELCYELAKSFTEVCKEGSFTDANNVPLFCMGAGNVLGALRQKGMISWDDDIDLFVHKDHESQLLQLKEALFAKGLEFDASMRQVHGLYKIRFTKEKLKGFGQSFGVECESSPDIDVAICEEMSDGSYAYAATFTRGTYPNNYFTKEEFEAGFEEVPFGPAHLGLFLPMLKREHAISYVKRLYGKDCLEYGVFTHGHFKLVLGPFEVFLPFFKKGAHRFKITKRSPAEGCFRWKCQEEEIHRV